MDAKTEPSCQLTDESSSGGRHDSSDGRWHRNNADEAFAPCQENAAHRPVCPPTNPKEHAQKALTQKHNGRRISRQRTERAKFYAISVVSKSFSCNRLSLDQSDYKNSLK